MFTSEKIFGYIVFIVGLLIIAVSLNIIPADEASFHAPRWIVTIIGVIFSIAGISVTGALKGKKVLTHLTGLVMYVAFLIISVWITFGPGERKCSSSINGIVNQSTSELSCRVVFGVGFVLLVILFIYIVRNEFKKTSTGKN